MTYCMVHKKFGMDHTNKEFKEDLKANPNYKRISEYTPEQLKNLMFFSSDVTKARKEHTCQYTTCKRKIKKGDLYLRRSFGQLWTIKACSEECFERMLQHV